jgi:hypothetical protein
MRIYSFSLCLFTSLMARVFQYSMAAMAPRARTAWLGPKLTAAPVGGEVLEPLDVLLAEFELFEELLEDEPLVEVEVAV